MKNHNNFFNPKKWQFDIDNDFVTQGKSYFFYKVLDYPETSHANFHADRYNTYIDSKILESVAKWNINDFESLYQVVYSADAKSIHKVVKRACHIYSQSFSINNLYERCEAIDNASFVPIMDNLPDIYV